MGRVHSSSYTFWSPWNHTMHLAARNLRHWETFCRLILLFQIFNWNLPINASLSVPGQNLGASWNVNNQKDCIRYTTRYETARGATPPTLTAAHTLFACSLSLSRSIMKWFSMYSWDLSSHMASYTACRRSSGATLKLLISRTLVRCASTNSFMRECGIWKRSAAGDWEMFMVVLWISEWFSEWWREIQSQCGHWIKPAWWLLWWEDWGVEDCRNEDGRTPHA